MKAKHGLQDVGMWLRGGTSAVVTASRKIATELQLLSAAVVTASQKVATEVQLLSAERSLVTIIRKRRNKDSEVT